MVIEETCGCNHQQNCDVTKKYTWFKTVEKLVIEPWNKETSGIRSKKKRWEDAARKGDFFSQRLRVFDVVMFFASHNGISMDCDNKLNVIRF